MLLTREEIVSASDLPFQDVDVPEWGGTVRVGTMTAGERDAYENDIYETDGANIKIKRKDFRAKMLVRCLKTAEGGQLFDDVAELSKKSSKPVQRLFEVAQELNGLGEAVQDEIEKN